MDTFEAGRLRRRRHSAEFKAKVVAACRQPGVSMAAVALAHGLNANLLRSWAVAAGPTPRAPLPATTVEDRAAAPTFVPLPLPAPTPSSPEPIRIELVRGGATIRVQWPLSAAAQCCRVAARAAVIRVEAIWLSVEPLVRISDHRGRPFQPIVDGISDERGRRFRLIVDDVSA